MIASLGLVSLGASRAATLSASTMRSNAAPDPSAENKVRPALWPQTFLQNPPHTSLLGGSASIPFPCC
jgi:hypothetical protein